MTSDAHILIAEDSHTQALQLRYLLLRHFARVSVVSNGLTALELMRTTPPTVVVTDVHMPGLDGYELCCTAKADPALMHIPVLLATATIELSDVVRGLECGASGFLAKPYDEAQIVERIRFLLQNPRLHRTTTSDPPLPVNFTSSRRVITSSREQVLAFLLSTYEFAVAKNIELRKVSDALEARTQELERSNAELEQFANIASHDLQQPLRMVSSYLGLLERRAGEKLEAKEHDYIHFAVDGAKRMQQMISDLLAYSRVGTHGKDFEKADLGEVLERALKNLEVAIREKGALVTHDPMPDALVDASQYVQLFQNLVGNAVKFTAQNAPAVHIGCRRGEGDEWLFSVRDNGIGIAAKDFDRIFQLFQRLHSRTEYPGSGIGLSVCKKIVERHGGHIWLESEVGRGTTFFFTLPDRAEPAAER